MTYKQLAYELNVTPVYLCMVINGKRVLSDKLTYKIELLFRRYQCKDFLDDKGRL
jgi:plasmid maintenance system antidote protein VapI